MILSNFITLSFRGSKEVSLVSSLEITCETLNFIYLALSEEIQYLWTSSFSPRSVIPTGS